jgi:succinate-semialdehyde dehydrogenase/glutarate-semialdehyde dehydrogenase
MSEAEVKIINPATEEVLETYGFQSPAELETSIEAGNETFRSWRLKTVAERAQCFERIEAQMTAVREELADLISREMGKVRKESLAEVDKCVASSKYLREQLPEWLKQSQYTTEKGYSVSHEPFGLLLGIMPWNFPLWQVMRFAIPAILNGNTVMIKHSTNTWGTALMLEKLFCENFPQGVYANLRVDHPVIEKIISDRRVKGVSLTGSRRAGSSVGKASGEHIKKCVLELGGSDPYVILDDANIELASKVCTESRTINAGQSCVSAKRFIVTTKNHDFFVGLFKEKLSRVKAGNPFDAASQMGPLARKDLREGLQKQVEESLGLGARPELGCKIAEGKGYFYPPSVLTNVKPGMPAFVDELFGPVASVIEASNDEEAIKLANRSVYGLGSAIFSRDLERAKDLARRHMDFGMVAINDYVRSDASAPFGGVRDSGVGREIGREGSLEFTNVKSVFSAKN